MKYGSMFPCSCLIVFQLIDLLDCLYIQIYTTEMVLSLQSSVAGRFLFVKAVDKQCIYIFVFVHYLSVLLHYVVSFWQGQFMMTYVKQYTLLELVMLNYLIQMDINQCKNIQQFLVMVAWYVAVLYQSYFKQVFNLWKLSNLWKKQNNFR